MTPDPVTCYECGDPVDRFAAACPGCGAPRTVARRRPAFGSAYSAGRSSALMRGAQIGAVAACIGVTLLGMDAFGAGFGTSLAVAVVMTAVQLLLISLLLAWSRRTRPYIPFVALALVAGISFMRVVVMDTGERAAPRFAASREPARWGAPGLRPFTPSPLAQRTDAASTCPLGRVRALFLQYQREAAARRHLTLGAMPSAWGTPRYMAAAGSHPEVGQFFAKALDYGAEMRDMSTPWLEVQLAAEARAAGMSEAAIDARIAICGRSAFPALRSEWEMEIAAARSGLALHRYLVTVDRRVRYDADRQLAVFERERDLEQIQRLAARFDRDVAAIREHASFSGFDLAPAEPPPAR